MNMRQQAERFGSIIVDDEVIEVNFKQKPFFVKTYSKEYLSQAILVCTGATPRKLGIMGEEEFGGRGVSYCATCDGPFFKGEEIAVVGGGDTALEEATFLTKFGKSVKLIHRRNSLKASKILQEKSFENPKIQFMWDSTITKISGNKKISKILIKNVNTQEERELNVGGLFIAIGHEPNTKIFKNQLEMDEHGYIVLKENSSTSIEGVFAAGDVHDFRYRQAVTAAGYGCMAALDVEKWLTETKNNNNKL
jgi:thioredoxin reductase (NADPH)